MKERFIGKFYQYIKENDGDDLFKTPVENTCTFEFENGPIKFSIELNENEMKKLVGECVKAFGLKAVISAASEADESDE